MSEHDGAVRGSTLESGEMRIRRQPDRGRDALANIQDHFADMAKQTHAARFGMWVFIGTETAMFSALFAIYVSYRAIFPDAFAQGTRDTNLWLGSSGTLSLLIADFLVALAIYFIRADRVRATIATLASSAGFAVLFLVFKFWEYARHVAEGIVPGPGYHYDKLLEPGGSAFFNLYWVMTGLHTIHVIFGIVILSILTVLTWRRHYGPEYHNPIELGGMYWHFVDIVWMFLWPSFYLMH